MEAIGRLDVAEKLGLVLRMVIFGLTTVASGQLLLVDSRDRLEHEKAGVFGGGNG